MLEIPWRGEIDSLCFLLKFYVESFTLWLKAWFLSFWGKIFKTEMKFLRQFVNIEKTHFHFKLHHWEINPLFSSADQRRVAEESTAPPGMS